MDRGAPRALFPLRLRPAKERSERRAIEVVPHLEVGMRRGARELVPRAHELTVIAAEDAVADRGTKLHRDRTVMLDGEIGDAAPRIEPIRSHDRARGAGGDAGLTGAAVGARRRIHRQREIGEELAEKEIRAGIAGDEIRVLADPAESRISRVRLLE